MPRALANVMAWAIAMLVCLPALAAGQTVNITRADFVMADGADPPPESAAWVSQALPDTWRRTRPGAFGNAWYRAQLQLPEVPREAWVVYIPDHSMNLAVFVNGVQIGDGGRFEEPLSRNWNRPFLFRIPAALLHPGVNLLHIRVYSAAMTQGKLSEVLVGPEFELEQRYGAEFFSRITVNQALTVIIAMVGVLMLTMWWRRRRDSMYGYFGASALVWAVNSSNLHVQQVPFTTRTWEILINASFEIFAPLVLVSLLRFVGREHRGLERLLWAVAIVCPLTLIFTPDHRLLDAFSAWHLVTLVGAIATLFVLVPAVFGRRSAEGRLLIAALVINVAFGAHDWVVNSKALPAMHGPTTRLHLLHFGAPVFFLIVGWILTSRFIEALNALERVNAGLEDRISAKTRELEENFRNLQSLRSEQAVLEERERIYRDLHDDIGAKLLQMVYKADNPGDADLARSALQDLRDVVSNPIGSKLTMEDQLADWRAEVDQRLTAARLQLKWQQGAQVAADFLQPHAIHVGRILREAVSNAIRHSGATTVSVFVEGDGRQFRLRVLDDGRGFDPEKVSHGSGLSNMRQRAGRVGGIISWHVPPEGGCCMELVVSPAGSKPPT